MLRMIIRRLLGAARLTTMRMQQPIPSASKLASGLAADPQHWRRLRRRQRRISLLRKEKGYIGYRNFYCTNGR
jgi:hypothetical protein